MDVLASDKSLRLSLLVEISTCRTQQAAKDVPDKTGVHKYPLSFWYFGPKSVNTFPHIKKKYVPETSDIYYTL